MYASPPGSASAACTPCRNVKMKCTREADSPVCSRCKRKSLSCFYETHRRGRKPGTKLRPKAERRLASSRPSVPVAPVQQPAVGKMSATPTMNGRFQEMQGVEQYHSSPEETRQSAERSDPHPCVKNEPARSAEPPMASDSLAPFGLLGNTSATSGNFTIANILNAENEGHAAENSTPLDRSGEDSEVNDVNDPVNRNLINLPTAQSLFDSFLKYMNPFICQFDPKLHTLRYIRCRSSFLFSALLSAAAKVFSPSLYMGLHDHVENLLREVLGSGQKSTEIVQGICLLTYWKEPRDSRAWLLVGYAIRACIEMGWHKLRPPSFASVTKGPPETEPEARERRNKERTWLMLFVYDRSVSLQLGKPWMIQIDPLIRNSESWHQDAYAVPGCDQIMSAFVQLRMIGSEILDLFYVDPLAPTPDAISKVEVFLRLFNGELDKWDAKWYKVLEDSNASICHLFIIRFYGAHLRLLLHSLQLQISIPSGTISKQALWMCYTSSLEMLQLVVDRLAVASLLYYVQDSIHLMVAYAAVVMTKILLSLPGGLPSESESTVLKLITETSENFGNQYSATNTSCYYQSRFLANVAMGYRKSKAEATPLSTEGLKPHNPHSQQVQRPTASPLPDLQRPLYPMTTSPSPMQMQPPLPNDSISQTLLASKQDGDSQQPQAQPQSQPPDPVHLGGAVFTSNNDIFALTEGQNTPFSLFTENVLWEDLFTNAGFDISNGAFLPNLG